MKSGKIFFGLLLAMFTLGICSYYACQKEPVEWSPDTAEEAFFSNGKFKKVLTVSDASGKNSVTFEVSANDESLLAAFDERSFEVAPALLMPATEGEATVPADQTDERSQGWADDAESEPEGDHNRYAVRILSTQTEAGVKGLELRRAATTSDDVQDRACPMSYGYYTNGTNTVGAVNYSANCERIVLVKYYRFNQGNPIPFKITSPYFPYPIIFPWWKLHSSKPGSGCYTNGPCCPEDWLSTDGLSKLTVEYDTNIPGAKRSVRNTYKSLNNNTVGIKLQDGGCQGNFLGVFIFI